jgi:UDPglucose--hexose-1-phosphate uridylyltransferase
MSEMRFNPITRDWVILAPGRSQKPNDFRAALKPRAARPPFRGDCPFCVGNEDPQREIMRLTAADGSWLTRVIPNKFPALSAADDLCRSTHGTFRSLAAVGDHEVVIEHPRHDLGPATIEPAHLAGVLRVYRERYRALRANPVVESIVIFKNHGERAGTSLEHPHSQIVGAPIIASSVRTRLEEASRFHEETGQCLCCRVLADELEAGERILEVAPGFVAFIPYAALSPYHLWIFPRRHASSFDSILDEEISDLADVLSRVLRRLSAALDDPDFNFTIRSAPVNESDVPYFHWYVSIVARTTHVAGFELGSGIFINSVSPEDAAATLRAATSES